MEMFANTKCMQGLMRSVQALAQPAEVQLSLFPEFVCKADELALDFAHFWSCTKANDRDHLAAEQVQILARIDSQLDEMSGSANAELWIEAALHENPRWEDLRGLAREALAAFGWSYEVPPDENLYVKGKPRGKCSEKG